MTQSAPPPRFRLPLVNADGTAAKWFRDFCEGLWTRSGGSADKIDAAHVLAANAVPQGTEVVATGGLQAGGALGGNVALTLYCAVAALASLPTAGLAEGDLAYGLDVRKPGEGAGSGTGSPVWWSNGAWFALCTGAPATN